MWTPPQHLSRVSDLRHRHSQHRLNKSDTRSQFQARLLPQASPHSV